MVKKSFLLDFVLSWLKGSFFYFTFHQGIYTVGFSQNLVNKYSFFILVQFVYCRLRIEENCSVLP